MSSHAASISAWCAVLDCPSIVAALSVSRHGPLSRSAARRKTAARSSHGVRDQSGQAAAAAAIAASVSAAPPWWTRASTRWRSCGATASANWPVVTSRPPTTDATSSGSGASVRSRASSEARSDEPGAYVRTGSLIGMGAVGTVTAPRVRIVGEARRRLARRRTVPGT